MFQLTINKLRIRLLLGPREEDEPEWGKLPKVGLGSEFEFAVLSEERRIPASFSNRFIQVILINVVGFQSVSVLPSSVWDLIAYFFCFLELRIAVGSVLFENESLWYSGAPASGRSWAGRRFPISDSNLSRHFLDFRLFIVSSSTYNQNILWSSPTSSIVFFFCFNYSYSLYC